jgi:fatty acid desaturase
MAATGKAIKWYRSPVSKADMAMLNQKSDLQGALWTLGFLALLATTASAVLWSSAHLPWYATVALLFVHGSCWPFLVNGFHELIHESVFKTRRLNNVFLWIYSFLGHHNPVWFWASHTEHHKYTLNPPDDMEVVLPQKVTVTDFLKGGIINYQGPYWFLRGNLRTALGCLDGEWTKQLFADQPEKHRKLRQWAVIQLVGHGAIIAVSCWFHAWLVPVVITGAQWYGGLLQSLLNTPQHIGLSDKVNDFRLNTRTIEVNPLLRFLYWNMNYHIEHHMYAAVPCYNLGKLHRLIADDLPASPKGLYATWKLIFAIQAKQKVDPTYQYKPELPAKKAKEESAAAAAPAAEAPATPAAAEPVAQPVSVPADPTLVTA